MLLCCQDCERLHAAFVDMQSYWNMLEWKRTQLEEEEKEKKREQPESNTLSEKIKYIQLDLRDLMSQVSSQVSTRFLPMFRPCVSMYEATTWSDKAVLLPSTDELHSGLLDEAKLSYSGDTTETWNWL